ncbi:hypothetical protein [Anditalea andensis]|uniref:O-antigen polymerase n=1 Tax=Anditalea andensis TaxID=1048983 RepID=A0A074KU85_9BACT|nr:hypothetical protein [Anditalea andensis]KEO71830.1 hypothetical protein EL17_21150 [Anditalea andensis]
MIVTKENFYYKLCLFALLFLLIGTLSTIIGLGPIKYFRFLTPMLLAPLVFHIHNENKHDKFKFIVDIFSLKLIVLFAIIIIITIITNSLYYSIGFTYRNFVNIIFLISPLIGSYVISKKVNKESLLKIINYLFWAFVFLYIITLIKLGVTLDAIIGAISGTDLTNSESETESGLSLIFGFFSLYFLFHKRYNLFLLSLFLVVLGGKRIAMGGVLLSIIVFYIYPVFNLLIRNNRNLFAAFFTVILFIAANLWTLLFFGEYDDVIQEMTGISPNLFFMGRLNRISDFFYALKDSDNYFVGFGLGYVENILYYFVNLETPFHNDFYRLFLEFGPILFCVWCFVMTKYLSFNSLSFSCFILLLILMQTDNVFIYETVMYPFYLITFSSLIKNSINKN